jgi:hypothetical protein
MVFDQGDHLVVAKACTVARVVLVYFNIGAIESAEPFGGTEPHESLAVFNNRGHRFG